MGQALHYDALHEGAAVVVLDVPHPLHADMTSSHDWPNAYGIQSLDVPHYCMHIRVGGMGGLSGLEHDSVTTSARLRQRADAAM